MTIAKPEGSFEGFERSVGHPQQSVTTGQVVPGDRPFASEPDNLKVGLERPVIEPAGREVVGMDPEHVGIERVAREDRSEEIKLEVELMLIAKPSRRRFRRGAIGEGVVGALRQCHR